MTPEELDEVERQRRKREDELILLLLLLLGLASREAVQTGGGVETIRRVVNQRAPGEIAESMSDAHLDVLPILGVRMALFGRDELIRLYAPIGRTATDAMLDTIAKAIVGAGGDVQAGLTLAGYSTANTNGLELGAERNIVTASNAGLLAAAIVEGEDVTGLEHVSILDDRTTDICDERDGLKLDIGHDYWRRGWP